MAANHAQYCVWDLNQINEYYLKDSYGDESIKITLSYSKLDEAHSGFVKPYFNSKDYYKKEKKESSGGEREPDEIPNDLRSCQRRHTGW